ADAELAAAVNQYLLAETLRSTDAARTVQRDKYLEDARIRFARLGAEFANSRVGWIAQAWRAEGLRGQSKGAEADTIVKDILASNLPEAEDGKRMVRFFQVRRDYQAAVDVRDSGRLQAVEKDLRAWLAKYTNPRKLTPEVLSAQFYLAMLLQRQAE